MDAAVGIVEAYLRVNGYFTVTEYPVLEAVRDGGFRTATGLDILAFRFPGPGRLMGFEESGRSSNAEGRRFAVDAHLGGKPDEADMLIGEVKEGHAELNAVARDPAVLRAALTRFGCCRPQEVSAVVHTLLQTVQPARIAATTFDSWRSVRCLPCRRTETTL